MDYQPPAGSICSDPSIMFFLQQFHQYKVSGNQTCQAETFPINMQLSKGTSSMLDSSWPCFRGLGLMSPELGIRFTSPKQTSVGYCIPNSRMMFNWDIYQPLCLTSGTWIVKTKRLKQLTSLAMLCLGCHRFSDSLNNLLEHNKWVFLEIYDQNCRKKLLGIHVGVKVLTVRTIQNIIRRV